MVDVFVSYAAEDRDRIVPLVERLTALGWSVWWDRELVAGPSFELAIEHALDEARCVVVAWSRHSVESRWCRAEATEGMERGVLVPLRLDDVRPPLSFRGAQTASLLDWPHSAGDLASVVAGISACLEKGSSGAGGKVVDAKRPAGQSRRRVSAPLLLLAASTFVAGVWVLRDNDTPETNRAGLVDADAQDAVAARRMAILPIRNLSGDDVDWIAGGLTEQLRSSIDAWGQFEVLPSALVRDRSIDELRDTAELVIDGYLRRDGAKTAVQLDVIDLVRRETLLSESFSGPADDPRALQQQIADNVGRVFNMALGDDGPANPAAYAAYLRYLHVGEYGNLDELVFWLERTVNQDPLWAEGWARLANRRLQLYHFLQDPKQLDLAQQALERADQADPGDPVLYFAKAQMTAYGRGDILAAEPMFERIARDGQPEWYAVMMMSVGLFEEAAVVLEHAAETRPSVPFVWESLAAARLALGDSAGAVEASDRVLSLNPPDATLALTAANMMRANAGDIETSRAFTDRLERQADRAKPGSLEDLSLEYLRSEAVAQLARAEGDPERLEAAVDRLVDRGSYASAALHLIALDAARAEALADRAADDPPYALMSWYYYAAFLSPEERQHPVFRKIATNLGITPELRLEVCRRAATTPRETQIDCDPSRYALTN